MMAQIYKDFLRITIFLARKSDTNHYILQNPCQSLGNECAPQPASEPSSSVLPSSLGKQHHEDADNCYSGSEYPESPLWQELHDANPQEGTDQDKGNGAEGHGQQGNSEDGQALNAGL